MIASGWLSGGTGHLRQYQANADFSTVGIPALIGGAGEAGVDVPTATAVTDMVGLTLDTATYLTAQQSGNADPEALVRCDIRPDIILKARLSGDGTTGTALSAKTVSTASTTGLAVTTGFDYSTTSVDEGIIWGYSGSNAGSFRKITSVSTTAATVTVAFPYDTAVGDQFLHANFFPVDAGSVTVTLTGTFDEVDTSVAIATDGAELIPIGVDLRDITGNGTLKSYVYLVPVDHLLNRLS